MTKHKGFNMRNLFASLAITLCLLFGYNTAQAGSAATVSIQTLVTAQNTWSGWIRVTGNYVVITNAGTGVGTVTLQRRYVSAAGIASANITSTTISPGVTYITERGTCDYQLGVNTGNYTSGTFELDMEVCPGKPD